MAFQLFPVEIWDMIVLGLGNSEDALNVYNAMPELQVEGVLFRTRQIWLFEKVTTDVIPHILQHLGKDDLLPCRQVCRKWSRCVDNFLDSHPTRKAYNHQGSESHKDRIREAASNYSTLPEPFELNVFLGSESLRNVFQNMIQHPAGRNPFIGRGLKLIREYNHLESQYSPDEYWTKLSQLFQRFGEHVWFLEIAFRWYYGEDPEPSKPLMRILPLLPNLKGLSMSIDSCDWYEPGSELAEETPFTNLTQLETLEMDSSIRPDFMDQMGIPNVFPNLRKLCMSIYHPEWWKGHSNRLPKLAELTIQDCYYDSDKEVTDFLLSLTSPDLFRLNIFGLRRKSKFVGGGISSGLMHFPKLSILELSINYFPWLEGERRELGEAVTSLKSLILHGFLGGRKGINFGFLRSFPSVEFLKLYGCGVREGFENDVIFDRELWSVKCPKLQEITVVDDSDDEYKRIIRYSREKYEYLSKVGQI